jgi:hypothetical protein
VSVAQNCGTTTRRRRPFKVNVHEGEFLTLREADAGVGSVEWDPLGSSSPDERSSGSISCRDLIAVVLFNDESLDKELDSGSLSRDLDDRPVREYRNR